MDLENIIKYTHSLSILYIEDDLDAQKHMSSILNKMYDKVDTAIDGKVALDTYKNYFDSYQKYYDLILCDIELPYINGIDLCKIILDINPMQHIIIVSAYNDKEKLEQILHLGIDNFLHKPTDYKEIL